MYQQFEGRGPELTWITVGQNIHPNANGYRLISQVVMASYLDATAVITTSVYPGSNPAKSGQKETFRVMTLPRASVVLALKYAEGGWHYQADRVGAAGLGGVFDAGWTVPKIHAKVAVRACASYSGKQTVCANAILKVE